MPSGNLPAAAGPWASTPQDHLREVFTLPSISSSPPRLKMPAGLLSNGIRRQRNCCSQRCSHPRESSNFTKWLWQRGFPFPPQLSLPQLLCLPQTTKYTTAPTACPFGAPGGNLGSEVGPHLSCSPLILYFLSLTHREGPAGPPIGSSSTTPIS
jgi:hypothetical protein